MCRRVTPQHCHSVCKYRGPFCGREISKEQMIKFASDIFHSEFNNEFRHPFLTRVKTHFYNPITVIYPELQWAEIKKQLQPFVDRREIKKIYLTGSIFLKQDKPHKDYDILLKIDDWLKVRELEEKLPKEILGTKCEYFFSRNPEEGRIFTTFLDMETKTLHVSSWYILIIIDKPQDLKVIELPNYEINSYILSQSTKAFEKTYKPCKKCPPKGFSNESK